MGYPPVSAGKPSRTRSCEVLQHLADGGHRLVDFVARHRQGRAETHALVPAWQNDHPALPQSADQLVAVGGGRQAECAHRAAAADVEHQAWELGGEFVESGTQMAAVFGGAG